MQLAVSLYPFVSPMVPDLVNKVLYRVLWPFLSSSPTPSTIGRTGNQGGKESNAGPEPTGQQHKKGEKRDRMIMSAIIHHTDCCPDSVRRALALRIR